jgi:hypothetical protein
MALIVPSSFYRIDAGLKMDYKRHIQCTFWLFYIPPQSSINTKLSSCLEYRGLMIVSKYFVGGRLWKTTFEIFKMAAVAMETAKMLKKLKTQK